MGRVARGASRLSQWHTVLYLIFAEWASPGIASVFRCFAPLSSVVPNYHPYYNIYSNTYDTCTVGVARESMLQLNSRHRIYIVVTFYRKYFVSFALPKELADGCRKALAAARSSSSLTSWLRVPPSQRRPFAPIDLGS